MIVDDLPVIEFSMAKNSNKIKYSKSIAKNSNNWKIIKENSKMENFY